MQPLGSDDPRQIGAYRLLGVLGAGGMGKVYLGRNAGGRTVAVKVIRPDLLGDPEFRARFRREVAAARRVGGACTAPVLDADVDADPPWLATGYVAGLALSDAVSRFGPFTEPSLLALGHGLAEALVAIHGVGIVHRDLKPSNVLLAVDGPKVVDFGIARAVEDTALTTTGKVIGSPGFMCPEQVTGEPLGPACDVFALGGVLTFAASGHGPFGTAEIVQMLFRIVYEEPRLEGVPARLRPLVAACVAKDPAARPTPQQVLAELTAIGLPERTGWLPPAVLEDVSRRAVILLDLDSGPADPPVGPSAALPPTWSNTGGQASFPGLTGSGGQTPLPGAAAGFGGPASSPGMAAGVAGPASSPGMAAGFGGQTQLPGSGSGFNGQGTAAGFGGHTSFAGGGPAQAGYATVRRPAGDLTGGTSAPGQALRPPARRGRNALVAAAVVVALAVAGGAFLIGVQLRDRSDGNSVANSTSISTSHRGSELPPATGAPVSTVPAAFVGSWQGRAVDGPVQFDITLTIDDGKVGQKVATASNTGVLSGERCERSETLVEATTDGLVLQAKLTGKSASGCVDDGATSTVTMGSNGTLTYRTPGLLGGTITGFLRKS
ncbi:serine/threonine-protein kinase [Nocardia sp. NPDC050718]|uniref:serine/threonine-protein kinase n=1 Tax=Nocardia sp. NPDC050718 TaxID=3155788 RepID=UPI0033E0F559